MSEHNHLFFNVFYIVRATSYEKIALHNEWRKRNYFFEKTIDDDCGTMVIGMFHGHHVMIRFEYVRVNGFRIMLWEENSEIVNYRMIDEWFDKHSFIIKNITGFQEVKCNAYNFHLCLQDLEKLK